jgi:pantoate kinase
MRAVSFAPGHISGFFEPIYNKQDMARTGSRGAGINVSLGAVSEVNVEEATSQIFEIYVNNKQSDSPVVDLALKGLIGEKKVHVVVRINLDLPVSQGFGMSAASAVSASYALAKIIGVSSTNALKASHFAEVQLRTGLGDVLSSCFGGIEIRKHPGLPPWGLIERIPGNYDLVLCVVGKKLNTKKILLDSNKASDIAYYGKYCTKKLLEKPSIENLFSLSQIFTKKTNLAEKRVIEAIEVSSRYGMASMCMLGNSVFAIGETNKLCQTLASFGEVFVCNVDEYGARVLEE